MKATHSKFKNKIHAFTESKQNRKGEIEMHDPSAQDLKNERGLLHVASFYGCWAGFGSTVQLTIVHARPKLAGDIG